MVDLTNFDAICFDKVAYGMDTNMELLKTGESHILAKSLEHVYGRLTWSELLLKSIYKTAGAIAISDEIKNIRDFAFTLKQDFFFFDRRKAIIDKTPIFALKNNAIVYKKIKNIAYKTDKLIEMILQCPKERLGKDSTKILMRVLKRLRDKRKEINDTINIVVNLLKSMKKKG